MTKKLLEIDKHPTLNEYLLLQKVLIKNQDISLRLKQIKKLIKNRISYNKINSLLSYLDYTGKIIHSSKGFQWIYNDNKNLNNMIKRDFEV